MFHILLQYLRMCLGISWRASQREFLHFSFRHAGEQVSWWIMAICLKNLDAVCVNITQWLISCNSSIPINRSTKIFPDIQKNSIFGLSHISHEYPRYSISGCVFFRYSKIESQNSELEGWLRHPSIAKAKPSLCDGCLFTVGYLWLMILFSSPGLTIASEKGGQIQPRGGRKSVQNHTRIHSLDGTSSRG